MTAFEEMGVLPELGRAVDDMEWMLPTDVQAEAIPAILGGGDVLMAAETGSGKTGAFCLPVLQIVWETLKDIQTGKSAKGSSSVKAPEFSRWGLNMFDRGEAMAITPDGILCQSRDPQKWHGSRSTLGVTGKGKYYFEGTVTDDGLCRVGWATLDGSLELGCDDQSFGFGGTGKKSFRKQFDSYGESYGLKDTIGCHIDLDSKEVHFSKNGKWLGKAFDIPDGMRNAVWYPAVCLKAGYIGVCDAPSDCVVSSRKHGGATSGGGGGKSSKPRPNAPMCLILEPSRELAEQTYTQVEKFKKHLESPSIRNLVVMGGIPAREQLAALHSGVDIVTGTIGRIKEFIDSGELSLSQVRFFILDEADGLLSQGNGPDIDRIYNGIPKVTPDGKRLQMVVCSATLHNFDVKKLANKMMHFPQWVDLKGQDSVPETVHHVVVSVDPVSDKRWINITKKSIQTDGVHARDEIRPGGQSAETLSQAVKMLKGQYVLQAVREHKMDQCLIFCRTKVDCDNMERWLKDVGKGEFTCVCLHGDRRPDERKRNLQMFKDLVINVTLPDEKQNYLHRIGRVGRAERMGLAISLVSKVPEKVWYHQCPSRGKSCNNARLTDQGGCTIWYKEPQLLADIEEHLGVTIQQTDPDIKVAADEFDGKVSYGAKRRDLGSGYQGHASQLAEAVSELAQLERSAQTSYLNLRNKHFKAP